jgi:ribosome-associated protein
MGSMSEVVRITPEVVVPLAELEFRASRASGPGGQGVNTTDSRVELRFDLAGSPSLPPEAKERVLRRLGPRVDSHGVLRVVAQAQRSQLANRRAATERFAELLSGALATPTPRRPTRPTRAAAARRVEAKRRRSATKRLRERPRRPDED